MSELVMEAHGIVKLLGEGAVVALRGVDLTLHGGELERQDDAISVLGCILSPIRGVIRVCGQATTDLRRNSSLNRDAIISG